MHTRDEGGNVEPKKPYNDYWSSSDNRWRYKRRPPPCSGPFCLQKVDVVRACLLLQVVVSDFLSSLSVAGVWIWIIIDSKECIYVQSLYLMSLLAGNPYFN